MTCFGILISNDVLQIDFKEIQHNNNYLVIVMELNVVYIMHNVIHTKLF